MVSGATKGIGRAIAQTLAAEGVYVCDLRAAAKPKCANAVAMLQQDGRRLRTAARSTSPTATR